MFYFESLPTIEVNPLIQIVIEEKQTEPVKEITWQDNPNNCDLNTQHIAAEKPFYCIDIPQKPKYTSYTPQNSSGNTYSYGYCTWWVKSQLGWVNNGWHNAYQWPYYAKLDGFTVSSTPTVGSVGVKGNHVVVVTGVSGNQFSLSEMNYTGWNKVSYRTVDISGWQFIR